MFFVWKFSTDGDDEGDDVVDEDNDDDLRLTVVVVAASVADVARILSLVLAVKISCLNSIQKIASELLNLYCFVLKLIKRKRRESKSIIEINL